MKTIFKQSISNNEGEAVLAVLGYKENGSYGYVIYPVMGAVNTKRNTGVRIIILHPVANRNMPSSTDEEFIESMKERCSRSSATKVKGTSMNIVVWNGQHIGYIADWDPDIRMLNLATSYGGEANFYYVPVSSLIESLEFDKEAVLNFTKETGCEVTLIALDPDAEKIKSDWMELLQ